MNNSEIFLLGLINQNPRYGYEISQFLEESNANLWINISMPYVYRLLKHFEEEGWVAAKQVESVNRPNKNVYEITEEGRQVLHEAMRNSNFGEDRIFFGMDVALAVYALTQQKYNLLPFIEARINKINEELEQFDFEGIKNADLADDAVAAILIIEHRIGFLQSELTWLHKVKSKLKKKSTIHF